MFNYGRIYGAGVTFAIKLLMQFNPEMSEQEAKRRAYELYKSTKGFKATEKTKEATKPKQASSQDENGDSVNEEPKTIVRRLWKNGSESEMFNKLEEIARSEQPRTPVLEARITSTLEPENVSDDVRFNRLI